MEAWRKQAVFWRTAEGGVADGGTRFSLYGTPNCGLRFCTKLPKLPATPGLHLVPMQDQIAHCILLVCNACGRTPPSVSPPSPAPRLTDDPRKGIQGRISVASSFVRSTGGPAFPDDTCPDSSAPCCPSRLHISLKPTPKRLQSGPESDQM